MLDLYPQRLWAALLHGIGPRYHSSSACAEVISPFLSGIGPDGRIESFEATNHDRAPCAIFSGRLSVEGENGVLKVSPTDAGIWE